MNMPADPVLTVDDLAVSFLREKEEVAAVRSVSFSVSRGQTIAIVGESGSGKSVSALALLHLLPQKTAVIRGGKILFHASTHKEGDQGISLLDRADDEMRELRGRELAMIFQEPMTSLNPLMTCGEQVSEMLRLHLGLSKKESRTRTIEGFTEVRLPRPEQIYSSYPHQLSGGQRQRVMIAMAVSCKPSVLIADEPTTALDVTVQKSILELLRALQQSSGMALIFITHDLGIVADLADEVVVMQRGEVVERGPVQQVLTHPQHAYTRGLLACIPVAGEKRERLVTLGESDGHIASTFRENKRPEVHEPFLEICNLTKTYSGRRALLGKVVPPVHAVHDVSFTIYEGETLGLVGESGCGKTTLSRMILGLIQSTSGKIIFRDKDLVADGLSSWKQLRKDFQIIFQDPYSSLPPRLSVGEILAEPMRVHGLGKNEQERRQRVASLLDKVGLPAQAVSRYVHEFSGGQRQRIVIARALSVEPRFVVCDEAVSALDVSVQAQVLNLLNDLKAEFGLTYLFISHNLAVVYHMSDRIMVMNKGRVEECGEAHQVYYHPTSEYTRQLIDSMPGQGKRVD